MFSSSLLSNIHLTCRSAFDKHCNLVLRDTQEEWALLCPSAAAAPPTATHVDSNAAFSSALGSDSPTSEQLFPPQEAASKSGTVPEKRDNLAPSTATSGIKHTAPHWGSYHSPPTTIPLAQCRLLRPSLLPSLPAGRCYAYVRKSHAQLLLLGNNVIIVHRADGSAKSARQAPPGDAQQQGRSGGLGSGVDECRDCEDTEKSSKRRKEGGTP